MLGHVSSWTLLATVNAGTLIIALPDPGAVISIALVMAIVTAGIPEAAG